MENNEYSERAQRLITASVWLFMISFIVGTLLLTAYLITKGSIVIIIGLAYVLFATFLNGIVAVNIVILLCYRGPQRMNLLWHSLLLTLNIPIALWYTDIVIKNM